MLESATEQQVNALRRIRGERKKEVDVSTLKPGAVIRVHTRRQNCYFFEATAHKGWLHMWRCESHSGRRPVGYRGLRKVFSNFKEKHRVLYLVDGTSRGTSELSSIIVLPDPLK